MNNIIIANYINNKKKHEPLKKDHEMRSMKEKSIFKILHKIRNDDRLSYNYDMINIENYYIDIESDILVYDLKDVECKNQLLEGIYCSDLTEIINVKFGTGLNNTLINLNLKENYIVKNNKTIKYYSFDDFPMKVYDYTTIKLYVIVKNINAEISIVNVEIDSHLYKIISEMPYEIMFDNKYVLIFMNGMFATRYASDTTDFFDHSNIANEIKEEIKKRIEK